MLTQRINQTGFFQSIIANFILFPTQLMNYLVAELTSYPNGIYIF